MRLNSRSRVPLVALLVALMLGVLAFGAAPTAAQTVPPCPFQGPCPPIPPCLDFCGGGVSTNPFWLNITHHRVDVTIADQIARTTISMEWVNEGEGLAEGTFLFPLPIGASVENLVMYINGDPYTGNILEADEAREIYDAIVRQFRDPALLEYVGMGAVQANVFPIPPGESRRIEITYAQPLEVDNGLIHYVYPMDITRLTSQRNVEEASIRVQVESDDPIGAVYSPSHNIAIDNDEDELGFVAGWEAVDYAPEGDFSLYYGVDSETISLNLLSARESATDDGFFMLLVQPPLTLPDEAREPQDLIIVLDQSGSMDGDKWTQAQDAANTVLGALNPRDRFNVILFSTGTRVFSNQFEEASVASEAQDWIDGMFPEGGTNINDSLVQALDLVEGERPTTILFITDGVPTEGETDPETILENIAAAASDDVRIFTFGVGDDVDTFILDSVARDFHGASSYVRTTERIDEEVASLYNKISAPVLTDVELTFDGITVDSLYPVQPLPDLFAGTQMTVVGRYRGSAEDVSVTLSGLVNGERQSFVYDGLSFRERAGGEDLIPRLWATRRIGDLLTSIRLNGENSELVDSIVNLSIRYGIITPYTSFLIEEDDILSQQGRRDAVDAFAAASGGLSEVSGANAVGAADMAANLAAAQAPIPMAATQGMPAERDRDEEAGFFAEPEQNPIQTVGGKTFLLQNGVWTDSTFAPDTMTTQPIEFLSDAYFELLTTMPELAEYFAVGTRVIVVIEGITYEVTEAVVTAP